MSAALLGLLLAAGGAATASALSERVVQATVSELLGAMSNAQKARQLMIQDVGVFLTNGNFDAAKAAAYLGAVGAGKIDSYGRNVDPILGNQIQAAILARYCCHLLTHPPSPFSDRMLLLGY
eukprot:SAG22_NODE_764_length_7397_cov_6.955604_1_plen_122_part_00